MSSLKPIYLALGFVGACSLVNKFDPVNEITAAAGNAGVGGKGGKGGAGGKGGTGGGEAGVGDTGNGGTGGTGAGGTVGASGEGGEAGQAGIQGTPITTGLIVVGSNVGTGASAKHTLILLDPKDGSEIASTPTALNVLAIAYEAQRNKWFIFTGTPGQSGDGTGPLLVGQMTNAGFQQEDMALVPKPTNQNTVAVLNQRILYRNSVHTGATMIDDTLTLLDTSKTVLPIAKLTIPYRYSLAGVVGRPASGTSAGGRAFFLHQNSDDATENCVAPDAGTEQACSVYYSSLSVSATDKVALTLPTASINTIAEVDRDGSFAAIGIQPGSSSNTVAVVVPPKRIEGADARVFKFNAGNGAAVAGGQLTFSLNTPPARPVVATASISIATLAMDPCNDLLFAGELANSAFLYGVPTGQTPGTVVAFDPQSKNGTVGTAIFEPFTRTLVSYNNDPVNPTFNGFQIGGTATAPTVAIRGKSGAAPWKVPTGLIPSIVVAQNPDDPPCK